MCAYIATYLHIYIYIYTYMCTISMDMAVVLWTSPSNHQRKRYPRKKRRPHGCLFLLGNLPEKWWTSISTQMMSTKGSQLKFTPTYIHTYIYIYIYISFHSIHAHICKHASGDVKRCKESSRNADGSLCEGCRVFQNLLGASFKQAPNKKKVRCETASALRNCHELPKGICGKLALLLHFLKVQQRVGCDIHFQALPRACSGITFSFGSRQDQAPKTLLTVPGHDFLRVWLCSCFPVSHPPILKSVSNDGGVPLSISS